MTTLIEAAPIESAPPRTCGAAREEYVCWTRMQAEAGQSLESILQRKERERRLGQGTFLWGVGNPPAVITNVLARTHVPVRTVFSIMKSRPRSVDSSPSRTVAWRGYIDAHGVERRVPPQALVTSKGDSATGAKRVHYALMCRSDVPLVFRRGNRFDPNAFRNAGGTGAPVGASQVTALLRRVEMDQGGDYEANLTAWLTEGYWVRLTNPVEISTAKQALLADANRFEDVDWLDVVADILGGPISPLHSAGDVGPLI